MKKETLKKIFNVFLYIFAAIGLFLTLGFFAVKLGLTNTKGIIDQQSEFFRNQDNTTTVDTTPRPWNQGPEWENFGTAISKDAQVLKRVESETGVPARLVVSVVFVEQMRLYFSERQTFKELFAPLKILGTQTQFSLGVSGIKQKTAEQVENNLVATSSPYYLGDKFAHYLDFKTTDIENERFLRLTDYKDRYYSYLYTALYIKELATSWKKAGFDISGKPEILATLFNIGFEHSTPNATPQSGGAEIDINNTKYSFGYLAGEFYYSNELTSVYPKQTLSL
ncbi:MAG: hypothetical protein V4469_03430 [Patescibacteria group bacterium]